MRLQEQHAVRPLVVTIEEIEHVQHVAETARHLLALGIVDECVVHPMIGERLPERDGLRPFVLVVREPEILATAVKVEALTQ